MRARMKIRHCFALLAIAMFTTASSQGLQQLPCAEDDKECLARAMRDHVVQRIATWRPAPVAAAG